MAKALLLPVAVLLFAGCGGSSSVPTPPAPAAPAPIARPMPPAETRPLVAAKDPPQVEPTPAETSPAKDPPAEAAAPVEKKIDPIDIQAVEEEVQKMFFFRRGLGLGAAAEEEIHQRVLELGDPGFEAVRKLATDGPMQWRPNAFKELIRWEDRREEAAAALLANLDVKPIPNSIDELDCAIVIGDLAELGSGGRSATPKLVEILRSESNNSNDACEALAKIGEPREVIIPAFIAALRSKNWMVRSNACQGLAKFHKKAEVTAVAPVVAALKPLLKDPEKNVRYQAVYALGQIGPAAKSAVPALTLVVEDPEDKVRGMIPYSLEEIGYMHPKVEAALMSLIVRKDDITWSAERALLKLGISETADPAPLLVGLTHKFSLTRKSAVELLARLKPADDKLPAVLAALLSALDDESYEVGNAARDALVAHAKHSRVAANELLKLLRSENADRRLIAAYAFVELGPAAKPYLADLQKFTAEEKEANVREALEEAMNEAAKALE